MIIAPPNARQVELLRAFREDFDARARAIAEAFANSNIPHGEKPAWAEFVLKANALCVDLDPLIGDKIEHMPDRLMTTMLVFAALIPSDRRSKYRDVYKEDLIGADSPWADVGPWISDAQKAAVARIDRLIDAQYAEIRSLNT